MISSSTLDSLRKVKLRPTMARIGILQIIGAAVPRASSADEVHRQMILRGTRASIGTVYRAVHQLEAKGLLLREWSPNRKALYRIKPADHDARTNKIFCRRCSRSVAFTDAGLLERLEDVAQSQGILIAAQDITIQVDCVGCSGGSDDRRMLELRSSPGVFSNRREACTAQP